MRYFITLLILAFSLSSLGNTLTFRAFKTASVKGSDKDRVPHNWSDCNVITVINLQDDEIQSVKMLTHKKIHKFDIIKLVSNESKSGSIDRCYKILDQDGIEAYMVLTFRSELSAVKLTITYDNRSLVYLLKDLDSK